MLWCWWFWWWNMMKWMRWYDAMKLCDVVMKSYEWYELMIWIPTIPIYRSFFNSPQKTRFCLLRSKIPQQFTEKHVECVGVFSWQKNLSNCPGWRHWHWAMWLCPRKHYTGPPPHCQNQRRAGPLRDRSQWPQLQPPLTHWRWWLQPWM